MADKTETQSLLRQIKYLTNLINSAKEKEERAKKSHGSSSFHAKGTASFTTVSSSYTESRTFPSSILSHQQHNTKHKDGTQNVTKGAQQHIQKQVSAPVTRQRVIPADKKSPTHSVSANRVQGSLVSPEVKAFVTLDTRNTHKLLKPANVLKEASSVAKTNINPKTGQQASASDHLSRRKAEVSLARQLMKNKIENIKESIAQLSAAKKNKASCKQCPSESGLLSEEPVSLHLDPQTGTSASAGAGSQYRKQTNMCLAFVSVVEHLSDRPTHPSSSAMEIKSSNPLKRVETILLPVKSANQNQTRREAKKTCSIIELDVAGSSNSLEISEPKVSKANHFTSNRESSDKSKDRVVVLKASEMQKGTSSNATAVQKGTSSKASAVADLQRELAETEKKLRCMRQKIGCMLKDSPTKTSPSRLVSHTDVGARTAKQVASFASEQLFDGKLCHSLMSSPKRPFPNRMSLKWTPQKHSVASQDIVPKAGSSPSLRSISGNVSSSKTTVSSQCASDDAHNYSPMSTSSSRTSIHSEVQHKSAAGRSLQSSAAAVKVQTTRCLFGKYILRNVKTGIVTARKSDAAAVKSHFQLVRNSRQQVSQVSAEATEPQSVAQRAAKVVVSKYKMQRVQTSFPSNKVYSSYKRQQSDPAGYTFTKPAAYMHYNFSDWKKGLHNRFQHQGSSKMSYQAESSQWWMNPQSRNSFALHPHTAFQAKQRAIALKMKMAYSRARHLYHYGHHTPNGSFEQFQRRLKLVKDYKLVKLGNTRMKRQQSPGKAGREHQDRMLLINGILYRSSSMRLTKASKLVSRKTTPKQSAMTSVIVKNMNRKKMHTVTVRGVRFKVDSRGTKLQRVDCTNMQGRTTVSRVDIGGSTFIQTKDGTLEKVFDNQTKSVVNRVKQRSIATAAAAKFKKDNIRSKKKLCLFYSRFGKCSRGDKCPYTHDPDKIAVCTRFLRGTCKLEQCPFSHKVSKEKMPVCAFFLRGVCAREDCPYLHVKVSHGAQICQDFVNGFCSLADKCKKLHTLTCPAFSKTGVCPDGRKCRLQHKREHKLKVATAANAKYTETVPESVVKAAGRAVKRKCATEASKDWQEPDAQDTEGPWPRKLARLPAFISLADYSTDESPAQTPHRPAKRQHKDTTASSSLQIKPRI